MGLRAMRKDRFRPTTSMIAVPAIIAMTVPAGPAAGRKVVPGIAKTPQPTMQPNAIAHTVISLKYGFSPPFAARFSSNVFLLYVVSFKSVMLNAPPF